MNYSKGKLVATCVDGKNYLLKAYISVDDQSWTPCNPYKIGRLATGITAEGGNNAGIFGECEIIEAAGITIQVDLPEIRSLVTVTDAATYLQECQRRVDYVRSLVLKLHNGEYSQTLEFDAVDSEPQSEGE